VDELENFEFDYVVTMCDNAKEVCPLIPATQPSSTPISMIRHLWTQGLPLRKKRQDIIVV